MQAKKKSFYNYPHNASSIHRHTSISEDTTCPVPSKSRIIKMLSFKESSTSTEAAVKYL